MADHYKGGGDKTVAKLVTLEKYVNAYIAIIKEHWGNNPWYIDTHAGTGLVDMEKYGAKVPGSAVRIIENHYDDFGRFYFYESDAESFDALKNTLAEEFELTFDTWENDAGFLVAKSTDPRIMLFRTNSNEGIQWLSREANPNPHWFVFMDPETVTDLEMEAISAVIDRGNTDVLINFQTTGAHRAAGWEPSRNAVKRLGGAEPLKDGTLDDEVLWFRENIEDSTNYRTVSRKTISETDQGHRFDLVFTSGHEVAINIMSDIMDKSLKKEIAEEIREHRSESGQQGLENWWEIEFIEHGYDTESESERGDDQSGLSDFG